MSGNNGCTNDENDYERGAREERARIIADLRKAREEPDHTQGWYDSFAAAIETVKFPPQRETSEPKSMGDNTHAVGAIFGIR